MNRFDNVSELAESFVALNESLRRDVDSRAALQRLVELAVTTLPGCDWAGITQWPATRNPRRLASSDDMARQVDTLQHHLREGPCLTAAADGRPVQIHDIATEVRWPRFCAAMLADTPVRSVLAFHLADEPHRAALNLYSARPHGFAHDFDIAALFAAHTRVLLLHVASTDKAVNLQTALTTSRQIGAAVGILMNTHRLTSDAAFELLRETSQHLNRKVYDVADDVTQTGTLPN